MTMTNKTQCEVLILLVAMTWAVAIGCVVYPASADALLLTGVVGLAMIIVVRRPLFELAGLRLIDDQRKLTMLRRRLGRGYLMFGVPTIAVALAFAHGLL